MPNKFSVESAGLVFDRNYTQGLQQAFSRITNELSNAIKASGSYVYTLGEDQSFTPLVAGGPITEAERALFLSKIIDVYPSTSLKMFVLLNASAAKLSDKTF